MLNIFPQINFISQPLNAQEISPRSKLLLKQLENPQIANIQGSLPVYSSISKNEKCSRPSQKNIEKDIYKIFRRNDGLGCFVNKNIDKDNLINDLPSCPKHFSSKVSLSPKNTQHSTNPLNDCNEVLNLLNASESILTLLKLNQGFWLDLARLKRFERIYENLEQEFRDIINIQQMLQQNNIDSLPKKLITRNVLPRKNNRHPTRGSNRSEPILIEDDKEEEDPKHPVQNLIPNTVICQQLIPDKDFEFIEQHKQSQNHINQESIKVEAEVLPVVDIFSCLPLTKKNLSNEETVESSQGMMLGDDISLLRENGSSSDELFLKGTSFLDTKETPIGPNHQISIPKFTLNLLRNCKKSVSPVWNPKVLNRDELNEFFIKVSQIIKEPIFNEERVLKVLVKANNNVNDVLSLIKKNQLYYKNHFKTHQRVLRNHCKFNQVILT